MTLAGPPRDGTCFFEADPPQPLARRALAEAVGSFLLTFTVIGSVAAWSGEGPNAPIARALSVGPALTAFILLFGQASGGHYNPLISIAQWATRRRGSACFAVYVTAQLPAAVTAALLAQVAFGLSRPPAPPQPNLAAVVGAEVFATAGLMLLVLGAPRMRPLGVAPFAVGGFVAMTIAGLPAAPAANPIITAAALACGLTPAPTAAVHLLAQAVGLLLALILTALIAPAVEMRNAT